MKQNPLTAIDFYKAGHRQQYPAGTTMVYSNFTARSDKLKNIPDRLWCGKVKFFGLQYFIKEYLIETWNEGFFKRPKAEVVAVYKRRMDTSLGVDSVPVDHIEALHDLGYLPLAIHALPEGCLVPIKVPVLTIYNTHPDFFWLTNYIESVMSCYLWKPITSATMAHHYRLLLDGFAEQTGADKAFVPFQAHDFSFRGMSTPMDAALSGAAHMTCFVGTDCVPGIDLLEEYYGADCTGELVGCSVPATEHSVMCMGGKETEVKTFHRLITEIYPKGIVSIVSDTWDFWKVITDYSVALKSEIMSRDGKVVFRPDSGDPIKIICGDIEGETIEERRGAVECLWEIFGGMVNDKGFKVLDSHVGLIYGDSITLDRANSILAGLMAKGFASSNVVFGVGSYTYQYTTRDTFGFAVKSTYGEINGKGVEIYKDPITDNGVKKSARGVVRVVNSNGAYALYDQQEFAHIDCALEPVFIDGKLLRNQTLGEIRKTK